MYKVVVVEDEKLVREGIVHGTEWSRIDCMVAGAAGDGEEGIEAVHKTYNSFKKGNIAHQNTNVSAEARLGETRMMNCGMEAAIVRYNGVHDIDVRFEDGAVVEHKGYSALKNGKISHPSINRSHGSKDFHGFICKQGFKDEDRTLYECICKHCGLEDVLTPQEMMEHEKLEHGEDK